MIVDDNPTTIRCHALATPYGKEHGGSSKQMMKGQVQTLSDVTLIA